MSPYCRIGSPGRWPSLGLMVSVPAVTQSVIECLCSSSVTERTLGSRSGFAPQVALCLPSLMQNSPPRTGLRVAGTLARWARPCSDQVDLRASGEAYDFRERDVVSQGGHALPSPATDPSSHTSSSSYSPPPWTMADRMEGNHEVSLLLAWKSCCRSVKKTPMQAGKPTVRACVTREESRTTQAHLPSVCSRAWAILSYWYCHSLTGPL